MEKLLLNSHIAYFDMKKILLILSLFFGLDTLAADLEVVVVESSGTDGAIDLTIDGGIAPYLISWTGPGGFTSSSEDISGLEPGTYVVTVNDNYCGVAVLEVEVGLNVSGILEYGQDDLSIFPNPTSEELNIQTKKEFSEIEVINALGQIVYQGDFSSKLNISNLKSGMFQLRLIGQEGITRKTFIVE